MGGRLRMSGVLLALSCIVVFAAGCSRSSANGSTPVAGQSAANGMQAYVSCLQQHGVTVTLPSARADRSPGARPSGVRPSGMRPSGAPSAGGGPGGGGFGGGLFGSTPPSGVDQQTWDAARQACSSLQPSRGTGGGADNSANRAYRTCLSDHGVTASTGPGRLDTADPKVAEAMKACEALRPTGRPSPIPSN